ncbi:uncharacterized protein LOC112055765 [Bicyclus anynana]|uniref:Odorant receptor n=1 Tax=Bicyclus anynana TaxID=110368 RepID=A0ABM3LNV1_BICAN|nr:uncharacterized protein LOC112055765 [Bicyclus anynana]
MFKKEDLEQEYNDYANGIIDPRDFYKILYYLFKIFQVIDGPIPKYTYIVKLILLSFALSAFSLLSFSFYHGCDTFDIPLMTEAGTYIILLLYKLLIIHCLKLHRLDYHSMQRTMREDFRFACTTGEKYRKRFFVHHITTRKIYKMIVTFNMCVGVGMNLVSVLFLLYYLITNKSGQGKRPLLFPFWYYDIDFTKTPVYEIAFMYSNFAVLAYAFNFNFYISTQIVWMRQICCKADIVMWHIEDVMHQIRPTRNKMERKAFDNLIRQRMRDIVKHHNSMDLLMTQYAGVYRKLLSFEQLLSAPLVCFSAYSICEKWEESGEINGILLILMMAAIILLFIPSYLCTTLSLKVTSIAFACWNIPFWDASTVIRPYLVLIMQKSLQPLPLKVPGLEEFSMLTFSNKMASAYSFFNMLRQVNRK